MKIPTEAELIECENRSIRLNRILDIPYGNRLSNDDMELAHSMSCAVQHDIETLCNILRGLREQRP